jgi:AraC-like DNA-binding protein/mannose-6-phosphate isomerase-like protein (cupin superfamily)
MYTGIFPKIITKLTKVAIMYQEKKKHGVIGFPFEIYNNYCKNGLSLYAHYHREFEIIYICSGDGIAYVDTQNYYISDGDILFINSGQLHGIVSTSRKESSFSAIVFAPEFLGKADVVSDKFIAPVLNRVIKIPTLIRDHPELTACLSQLTNETDGAFFELTTKHLLYKIWGLLLSQGVPCFAKANDTRLKEIKTAIDYMNSNYSQKITLDQLAKSANMSKVYFCRKFTEAVGISPIHFLMQTRIENSCQLLKNTDIGIGSIAMECGFSSFSYYSEVFKKIVGCTPQSYRRNPLSGIPSHK